MLGRGIVRPIPGLRDPDVRRGVLFVLRRGEDGIRAPGRHDGLGVPGGPGDIARRQ
ncbi:MAG: hypothetical protein MZV63_64550 [Marinilabiliales bacterium]|nr:hypothetical protein [Marinilabiliales bacterium]